MNSRRKFMQNSAALVGGSLLVSAMENNAFAIFKNRVMPSDQLNIGLVGAKGMGFANLRFFKDINHQPCYRPR